MASVLAIMISVLTYSPLGLIAVPLVLLISYDLGPPRARGDRPNLGVTRVVQQKAMVEERVLVELRFENRGGDLERLTLKDMVPPGARIVRGSPEMVCGLRRNGTVTMRYEIALEQPSEISFEGTEVRVQSLLGLFEQKFVLPSAVSLRAYPKLLSRKMAAGEAKALAWAGSSPSRYKGGRIEFIDIRGYVPGDPLKDINWKASARLGRHLVNEWSVERGLDCIVVVDMSAENLPVIGDWSGQGGDNLLLLRAREHPDCVGNRVGMLILGATPIKIRPGFGSRHLRLMLDQLVLSQPGSAWKMEHVDWFLEAFFRTQYRKRGGTLVFVTAGVNTSLLRVEKEMVGKGFTCNSVIVNTLEKERSTITARKLVADEKLQSGFRLARAELDWFETQLSSVSSVTEWGRERGFIHPPGAEATLSRRLLPAIFSIVAIVTLLLEQTPTAFVLIGLEHNGPVWRVCPQGVAAALRGRDVSLHPLPWLCRPR